MAVGLADQQSRVGKACNSTYWFQPRFAEIRRECVDIEDYGQSIWTV